MKLSKVTTSPDAAGLLLQEYRASWAGLSSPLRTFPTTTALSFRHTSLTKVWREEQASQ
ncbi:MAG TPA: hypothetical protein VE710_16230 [Candidatus Bathyarchaeia archaeon]|nr:hypothetical protein [Candidatus Bathyarchaeia archaeon]